MSSDIQVLSAGAVKTGVGAAAEAFAGAGLGQVCVRFATAPTIRAHVDDGSANADLVIVPPGAMQTFAERRKVDAQHRIPLGRVGAGVAIRDGAAEPDISSVEGLKRALLAADSVVFNKASTGLYIETLLERLGLTAALAGKIMRGDNGAAVMNHLLQNRGVDLGFGAITEILVFKGRGVRLVGPLPAEIQNYTRYEAALLSDAENAAGARGFIRFLASDEGRKRLRAGGIEE